MGKHKYIETPEKMWELFCEYAAKTKQNPRKKMVFVGKDGNKDYELLERPLTMEGFECFVMDNTEITYPDLSRYFANQDDAYIDYLAVCSRIKREIKNDQIEGGMVGQYNASITQRLNGLAEKTENKTQHEVEIFKGIDLDVK
jgi:hypothetical protein